MIRSNLDCDLKMAFIALCNTFVDSAWKAKRYSSGSECFGGRYFIAGVSTDKEVFTQIFPIEQWDLFKCKEIERVPMTILAVPKI